MQKKIRDLESKVKTADDILKDNVHLKTRLSELSKSYKELQNLKEAQEELLSDKDENKTISKVIDLITKNWYVNKYIEAVNKIISLKANHQNDEVLQYFISLGLIKSTNNYVATDNGVDLVHYTLTSLGKRVYNHFINKEIIY